MRTVFFLFALIGFSCAKPKSTLFTLVDPDDSGVEFENKIFEDDRFNIIEVEHIYNGGGVSIGDFDNDGFPDIFFTGNMVPNKLYLNKGDLRFDDISAIAGIEAINKWKSGSAVVDINGDGLLDIYVCTTLTGDSSLRRNMLFVNKGLNPDGIPTFVDEAKHYGIDYSGFSTNAVFFDYDNDGDLDLYILTNIKEFGISLMYRKKINDGSSVNTDVLYENLGNGKFINVSSKAGIVCDGYGLGVAVVDINKDGFMDVYVSNDYITNDVLYVNQGNGTFKNEIDSYLKHQSKFSMGNDFADINNDGFLDMITVDMLPENNFRRKTVISSAGYITYINDQKFGYTHQYVRNMVQLNNGNGSFSEIGQLSGVYQTEWSWSPLFADFDNDGFKDLIVTNGFPKDITDRDFISFREKVHGLSSTKDILKEIPSILVPNYAFKNNGDLTFSNVTNEWGMGEPSFSNGAAFSDLDNDGDLDYIVSNINSVASIYENNLNQSGKVDSANRIRIKLIGENGNRVGLGSRVTIYYDGKSQYTEQSIYRGYLSTVEEIVHFGLGREDKIDSVKIEWPNNLKQTILNPTVNQVLVVDIKDATPFTSNTPSIQFDFEKIPSKVSGVIYQHTEVDKIDFNLQRTIPHKFSQQGPGLAVGDVNSDGLEDFIVGGSANEPVILYLQNSKSTFIEKELFTKVEELTGLLLFDFDGDNDLDLYAASGSIEFEPGGPNYLDKVYLNDGKGNFKYNDSITPKNHFSGSCVRAADWDADGDLDLFVGGRIMPGKYPFAGESQLLLNDGGVLKDVTDSLSSNLRRVGMVTDAIWTDYNNDDKVDLVVVGEFMAVTIFQNSGNMFKKLSVAGLDQFKGWFNSISQADFDKDGDIDFVVGNLGLNNYYNVSSTQPVVVQAKDFDGNGSIDAVLSCYTRASDGTMKLFPVHFWEDLNTQSPFFRRKFDLYSEYAATTTESFFSPTDLMDATILKATSFHSAYLENLGDGSFLVRPFDNLAQTAPVNGIVIDDFNEDSILDILMIGNDYGYEPNAGQFDAFTGLVLYGSGDGNFKIQESRKTGFFVNGDAKALVRLSGKDHDFIIASQNRDSLKVFTPAKGKRNFVFKPQPLDAWAILKFADGKKQKVEFYYGSGYLSQSTRNLNVPKGVIEIEVFNSRGESRKIIPELI